jgi:hypothetical protein
MKRYIFLFVFGTLTLLASAQDRPFNFGLHGLTNISWIKSDVDKAVYKSDGATMHMGYGAEFNYFFIKNLGIGTGIDVVYSGGKLKYTDKYPTETDSLGTLSRKYRLQYLSIPIVLIGSTGDMMGDFSIYAKFGLGTSFKLKARANDEFWAEYMGDQKMIMDNTNISKDVSFIRESMIIGLGGTYRIKDIISVNLGLTYNNGFTDILTGKNKANMDIKENAKLNYFEISLGLLF